MASERKTPPEPCARSQAMGKLNQQPLENPSQPVEQDFSSTLVNRGGIVALLLLAAASTYFGNVPLTIFFAFVALMCLLSYVWGRYALHRVELKVLGQQHSAFPGQRFPVVFQVSNGKLLPLIWLEILLRCGEKPCVVPTSAFDEQLCRDEKESKKTYRAWKRKFTWVLWHQDLVWKTEFEAVRRGVYFLDEVEAASGDGFGLSIHREAYHISNPPVFVVYPRLVDIRPEIFRRNLSQAAAGGRGFYEDRTLLKSSRSYQHGDNFKNINWRMAARQNELQVNIYESIRPQSLMLILDTASYRKVEIKENTGEELVSVWEEDLEEAISLAGSIIVHMSGEQMACGLLLAGQPMLLPSAQESSCWALLSRLAALTYDGQVLHVDLSEAAARREELGQVFVLARSAQNLTCGRALERLGDVPVTLLLHEKAEEQTLGMRTLAVHQVIREGSGPK